MSFNVASRAYRRSVSWRGVSMRTAAGQYTRAGAGREVQEIARRTAARAIAFSLAKVNLRSREFVRR
jgi:hypothetical protein